MPTVYLRQIDAVLIDSNGVRTPATGKTILRYNETAASSLSDASSDSEGIIAASSITADVGDVIRFSHATHPGDIRIRAAATPEAAFFDPEYPVSTYVMQNDATLAEAEQVDLWAYDDDNPAAAPILLGTSARNTLFQLPVTVGLERNWTVVPSIAGKDRSGLREREASLGESVTIPASGGGGDGDVVGPGSSVADTIALFASTTGKLIKQSIVTIAAITGIIAGTQGINLAGSTSGSVNLRVPATAGSNTITLPAGTTDFSATGGANQFLRQSSAGGAFTVSAIRGADLTLNLKTVYLETYGFDNAGVAAAISAIGSTVCDFVITENVTISANQTFNANTRVCLLNGAKITVSGGSTVTISRMLDPGNVQCFAGVDASNHVVFANGAVERYNLAWYMGIGSTADCTFAVNDIITSVNNSGGGTMFVPAGRWKVDDITCPNYFHIQGVGMGISDTTSSVFIPTDSGTSYLFRLTSNFRGFSADSVVFAPDTNTTTSGLLITGTSGSSGFGVNVTNCTFFLDGASVSNCYPILNVDTDQAYEVMRANFHNCQWIGADDSENVSINSVNTQFSFQNCSFITGKGSSYAIDGFNAGLHVQNCDFRGQQADFDDDYSTYATLTCSINSGFPTLTGSGFTKKMEGQRVYHSSALPSGYYIKSVDSSTQATLNANAAGTISSQSVTVYKWGPNANRAGTAIRVGAGAMLVCTIDNCAEEAFNEFLNVVGGSFEDTITLTNNLIQSKVIANNSCTIYADGNQFYSNAIEVASGQNCHLYGSNTVWDNTVEQVFANPLAEAKLEGPGAGDLLIHDAQFTAGSASHSIDQSRFYKEIFVPDVGSLSRPLLGVYTTYEATAGAQQILQAWGVRDSVSHQKKYSLTLDRAVENPYAGYYRWTSTQDNPYKGMIFDLAVGYGPTVRGTITQITSRTTGVTVNALHGIITCYDPGTYLLPGEQVSFTVTNSFVQNSDQVEVNIVDGSTTGGFTKCTSSQAGGNTFLVTVHNTHVRTSETGTLKIKFRIKKDGGQLGINL